LIFNSIAKVNLTQVYHNNKDITIDTEYCFPINDLGVFNDFTAIY